MTTARFTHAAGTDAEPFVETFTDTELLEQPMGYWTGAASQSIVGHIASALGEFELSQPNWWVLYRVGASPEGLSRTATIAQIAQARPFVNAAVLPVAVEELTVRALLAETDGHLRVTAEGARLRDRLLNETIPAALARVRDGVTDEEYALTVRVLRRMIANTGGDTSFTP